MALVDELSLPADLSPSSSFSELLGSASRRFDTKVPVRLDLSGYLVRYADAPAFDQEAFSGVLLFDTSAGTWRTFAGPRITQTTLDADGFERAVGVQLQARRRLSDRVALDLRFLYDDIDSPTSRYDFISGSRSRARATLESRPRGHRLRVSYEHEWNDRSDARVSPQRDRLTLAYRRALSDRWSLDGDLAYRRSRYGDLAVPRRERLFDVGATAHRALGSGWLWNLEYRWLDNDASAPQFSYRSHRATIGFGKSF